MRRNTLEIESIERIAWAENWLWKPGLGFDLKAIMARAWRHGRKSVYAGGRLFWVTDRGRFSAALRDAWAVARGQMARYAAACRPVEAAPEPTPVQTSNRPMSEREFRILCAEMCDDDAVRRRELKELGHV